VRARDSHHGWTPLPWDVVKLGPLIDGAAGDFPATGRNQKLFREFRPAAELFDEV